MSPILKEEDHARFAKFLKEQDSNYKEKSPAKIKKEIKEGMVGSIVLDRNIIIKKEKQIAASAQLLVFKESSAEVRNILFNQETTVKELYNLIKECIEQSQKQKVKHIEIIANKELTPLLEKMGFETTGERTNTEGVKEALFRQKQKEEKQINLKEKLQEQEMLQDISTKMSEGLRRLR